MVVRDVADAVEERVAQPHVGRGHVDLGAEGTGAVGEFAGAHALEEIEVFLDRARAERTVLAGFFRGAAVGLGVLGVEIANVGFTAFDELDRVAVELLEIVAGEEGFAVGAGGDGCAVVVGAAVD